MHRVHTSYGSKRWAGIPANDHERRAAPTLPMSLRSIFRTLRRRVIIERWRRARGYAPR
jgi:hypothetical protein